MSEQPRMRQFKKIEVKAAAPSSCSGPAAAPDAPPC